MAIAAYFEQIEQKINHLIAEKKYKEAYNLCKLTLTRFPGERFLVKLMKNIEREVADDNDRIIKEKIQLLEPLWKEENYSEILKVLSHLTRLDPENGKVKKLHKKAKQAYLEKAEQLTKNFIERQKIRLGKILEDNPDELIDELFYLDRNNPKNTLVLRLTNEYREELIKKKIAAKKELLASGKYEDIARFIEGLKRIQTKSPSVKKLETEIRNKKAKAQLDAKREFVYEGKEQLTTLMKLKKYDKAIRAAGELIKVNKNDKKTRKILKVAKRKFYRQSKKETAALIAMNLKNLIQEYQRDKNQYIKL